MTAWKYGYTELEKRYPTEFIGEIYSRQNVAMALV
jgi:hypothetical protein